MVNWLNIFLLFGALGPLPSVVMYIFFPSYTVVYFNGDPSPTSNFWCSVNASEDAMISFLCWAALFSKSAGIKQLEIRTFGVYAVFHWGMCWWWSAHGTPHPPFLAYSYPVSIGLSLAATSGGDFGTRPKNAMNTGTHPLPIFPMYPAMQRRRTTRAQHMQFEAMGRV